MSVLSVRRLLFIFMISGLFCGFVVWMGVRGFSISRADKIADEIIAQAYRDYSPIHDSEKVVALGRGVYEGFEKANPYSDFILRLRPYLTNDRMPAFLRVPDGVIETNLQRGLCDNASRMLAYVLDREGYASVQWNMITDKSGHSARLVSLQDGDVLVDPFYGVVARYEGALLHPEDARKLVRNGLGVEQVFEPFDETRNIHSFYDAIVDMHMAAEGDGLIIKAEIPALTDGALIFGGVDGDGKDVRVAMSDAGMSAYWNYMGHRYNREWVRVLEAVEPVRVVFTLVDAPNDGVMIAAPAPIIQGRDMIWELDAGDMITLHDGQAKISWRRMNSFITVDQIRFEAL